MPKDRMLTHHTSPYAWRSVVVLIAPVTALRRMLAARGGKGRECEMLGSNQYLTA